VHNEWKKSKEVEEVKRKEPSGDFGCRGGEVRKKWVIKRPGMKSGT